MLCIYNPPYAMRGNISHYFTIVERKYTVKYKIMLSIIVNASMSLYDYFRFLYNPQYLLP